MCADKNMSRQNSKLRITCMFLLLNQSVNHLMSSMICIKKCQEKIYFNKKEFMFMDLESDLR